jgi:serine/threonine-protein kinase
VAYYLLAGVHVFEGGSVLEVCSHHLHSAPKPPSERLGRPLPDDLESLVLRCLEKDPASRPSDARALSIALGSCVDAGRWTEAQADTWWSEHAAPARGDHLGDVSGTQPTSALSATIPVDLARRASGA